MDDKSKQFGTIKNFIISNETAIFGFGFSIFLTSIMFSTMLDFYMCAYTSSPELACFFYNKADDYGLAFTFAFWGLVFLGFHIRTQLNNSHKKEYTLYNIGWLNTFLSLFICTLMVLFQKNPHIITDEIFIIENITDKIELNLILIQLLISFLSIGIIIGYMLTLGFWKIPKINKDQP